MEPIQEGTYLLLPCGTRYFLARDDTSATAALWEELTIANSEIGDPVFKVEEAAVERVYDSERIGAIAKAITEKLPGYHYVYDEMVEMLTNGPIYAWEAVL